MADNHSHGSLLKPLQWIILAAVISGGILLFALKIMLPNTSIKTYALFRYELLDSTEEGVEICERYRVLLDAVIGPLDRLGDSSVFTSKETNVFFVPCTHPYRRNAPLLDQYNFDVSKKYVAALIAGFGNHKRVAAKLRKNPGPFLVSLIEPLGAGGSHDHLLIADLSRQNKNSIREAVEIYKQRLEKKPLDSVEALSSMRLKLAGALQDAQENLLLIKVSVKEIRELIAG